jgi:dienelactone hydrolase
MTDKRKPVGSVPPVRNDIRGDRGDLEMKRRAFLETVVGAAILGGASRGECLGCEHDARSVLKSVRLITIDTAAANCGRHKVAGTQELIRHDIEVYRVTYTTRDPNGVEVVASGAILVPKMCGPLRVMCYGRGTIIPVHQEKWAPSYYNLESDPSINRNYEMSFLAATFASAGYVVVVPDGIGYGSTKDQEHPYCHSASLASTSLDMLRAAREFARLEALELEPSVFITGWSEGALNGMALHQRIEDTRKDEFPVAASSIFAGPYALSAMADLFCSYDEDFPEHQIYYWAFRSMARVYKVGRPFDRIVVPPFAAALAKDVLASAPKKPRNGLDAEFRLGFLDSTEKELRQAFKGNDRYDWKPLAPVFLHHGTQDDIVPFFCAQMAFEAMRAQGSRVKLYPYLGKDHYEPVNAYVTTSLADFAAF